MGANCLFSRGVSEAYSQRQASLFATFGVEQDVSGDTEDPRSGFAVVAWCLITATPNDEERISYNILGGADVERR